MEQSVEKEVFEMRSSEEIKRALEHCRTGVPCAGCPYSGDGIANCWDNFTHDLIVYIQQLEAQQPRWISVGERLPDDAERVYVALRGGAGGVYIAQYFKNKCQPQEDFWMLENDWEVPASPTHWMPLPQPPEEE